MEIQVKKGDKGVRLIYTFEENKGIQAQVSEQIDLAGVISGRSH